MNEFEECDCTAPCCPACHALPGQLHREDCPAEQCPYCGGQLGDCQFDCCQDDIPIDFQCPRFQQDRLPWDGDWPGARECRRWGWYVRQTAWGWVECDMLAPGACLDLQRLLIEARWDRSSKRFRKR